MLSCYHRQPRHHHHLQKLCLMSGEIIAMTEVMSMMFEPMDLLVASPATVSRCGMIYLEPEMLGWKPLLEAWLETNRKDGKFFKPTDEAPVKFTLFGSDVDLIQGLFNWLVEPALCFIRKEGVEMSPTVDSNLVMSLLNILEALLARGLVKYRNAETGAEEEIEDARMLKQRFQDIECCFFFGLLWSVGKSGTALSQGKFSSFINSFLGNVNCIEGDWPGVWNALMVRGWQKPQFDSLLKGQFSLPMPMRNDFYECIYSPEDSKWRYWTDLLPAFTIPADTPYSSIVVPNSYTAQFAYMLELLVPHKKNVLMCGPTGTGKSVYILNIISKVMD